MKAFILSSKFPSFFHLDQRHAVQREKGVLALRVLPKHLDSQNIGAVDGILELENRINGEGPIEINMSHMIESSVRDNTTVHISKKLLIGPLLFYLVVSGVLVVGVVLSAAMFFCG